jgi:AraC-like DNA-binding protein
VDKRYQYLTIEEVSDMVGFGNRQSFYASFFRLKGITPRQYRLDNLQKHPAMVAKRK